MKNLSAWMLLSLVAAGCVEQPPRTGRNAAPNNSEIEATRRRVASTTAPAAGSYRELNVNFGDKVTLLGYSVTPADNARPGSTITVTWYWRSDATAGDGWRLFTHLDDAQNPRQNEDGNGEVRRAYQPERWRRGEYITDRQVIQLPDSWDSPVVRVHVGLWRNDERMRVVRGGTATTDGRLFAFQLNTGIATRVSEMDVPHTSGAITVDGRLDEADWRTAGASGPLVNTRTGAAAGATEAHGTVRVLWDDQNLYLGWDVQDENLIETGTERDLHYWENDAVEMLLDPDGDGHNYYELQVSPGGHTFDSQQPQPPTANNFGNLGWNPNLQVRTTLTGTLGVEGDQDTGYVVELSIPWTEINAGAPHTPPRVGDVWRGNFFVMDKARQGGQRAAAWSAPRGETFHATERFGRLTFRGPAGAPGAAAPAPAAPTAVVLPAGAVPPGAPAVPGVPAAVIQRLPGNALPPAALEAVRNAAAARAGNAPAPAPSPAAPAGH